MSELQNLRIALLEDDAEQAARVGGWIEERGYHCGAFSSADAFQRAFKKSSFDVVVLDWCLDTGSSGLEVLHWIRKTLTSDVPIIFVTARQSEDDIVTALGAGADDYTCKPVRRQELLAGSTRWRVARSRTSTCSNARPTPSTPARARYGSTTSPSA